MTIADWAARGKPFLIFLAIILAGSGGTGLGMLLAEGRAGKQDQLWIEQLPAAERATGALTATTTATKTSAKTQVASVAAALPYEGPVYASKTGTTYYAPACTSRIKAENKVTYSSRAAAEAKGLKPSKTCKGL